MVGLLGCGCCNGGGGEPCPNDYVSSFTDDFSPDFDPYWPTTQNKFKLITRDGKCQVDGSRFPTQTGSYGQLFGNFRKATKLGYSLSVECVLSAFGGLAPRFAEIVITDKLTSQVGFGEVKLTASFLQVPPWYPLPYYGEWVFSINGTVFWQSESYTLGTQPTYGDVFKIELIDFFATSVAGDPNPRYVAPMHYRVWINGVIKYVTPANPAQGGVYDFCSIQAGLRMQEPESASGGYIQLDNWSWQSQ